MIFRDWREIKPKSNNLQLHRSYVYYLHARSWGYKGIIGGTHSWISYWCSENNKWLTVEISDRETIDIQQANIIWIADDATSYTEKYPMISDRVPDTDWFGSRPKIVDRVAAQLNTKDVIAACLAYPYKNYELVFKNCNTFISYIQYRLNVELRKPLVSIGYKYASDWNKLDIS